MTAAARPRTAPPPPPPPHPAPAPGQAYPTAEWRRGGGRPLTAGLEGLSAWLLAQHAAAHGPGARAEDIVLVLHFSPFGVGALGAAAARVGAALPPARVADSCLLAMYAQSQGGAPPAPAPAAGGAGGAAGGGASGSQPAPAAGGAATLQHLANLGSLVERFAPAWLPAAPWYVRPFAAGGGAADALSDARSMLVATRALSTRVWGDADAWRAFALGTSCPLADALGRAGCAQAARAVAGWRPPV